MSARRIIPVTLTTLAALGLSLGSAVSASAAEGPWEERVFTITEDGVADIPERIFFYGDAIPNDFETRTDAVVNGTDVAKSVTVRLDAPVPDAADTRKSEMMFFWENGSGYWETIAQEHPVLLSEVILAPGERRTFSYAYGFDVWSPAPPPVTTTNPMDTTLSISATTVNVSAGFAELGILATGDAVEGADGVLDDVADVPADQPNADASAATSAGEGEGLALTGAAIAALGGIAALSLTGGYMLVSHRLRRLAL